MACDVSPVAMFFIIVTFLTIDSSIGLICNGGQTLGLWYDGGSDGPRADDSVFIECQYVCQ